MLDLSFTNLGLEDAVPDVGKLVAASIPVQILKENAYVHWLSDASPVLVCFATLYRYTV